MIGATLSVIWLRDLKYSVSVLKVFPQQNLLLRFWNEY